MSRNTQFPGGRTTRSTRDVVPCRSVPRIETIDADTKGTAMPNNIEITMTQRGYAVTIGASTSRFTELDDAVAFARQKLARAAEIREVSRRID